MNRQQRRAQKSQHAKLLKQFGTKSLPMATHIAQAYGLLGQGDIGGAAKAAGEAISIDESNHHPWVILGLIALDRHEAETSLSFFEKADQIKPKDPIILAGMGKAHVLLADPFKGVEFLGQAMQLKSQDVTVHRLYYELMARMKQFKPAGHMLRAAGRALKNGEILAMAGDAFIGGEAHKAAGKTFREAQKYAPELMSVKIGAVKASLFEFDYEAVIQGALKLFSEDKDRAEELAVSVIHSYRALGKTDEAVSFFEAFEFSNPANYQKALSAMGNVMQDLGNAEEAEAFYEDALYAFDGGHDDAAKGYGQFLLGKREVQRAAPYYAKRTLPASRQYIVSENASPEHLAEIERLFLIEEQGIGDQLAMLPLAMSAARKFGIDDVTFVTNERAKSLVKDNGLGLKCISWDADEHSNLDVVELSFLGDYAGHLHEIGDADRAFGGYLKGNPEIVAKEREAYEALAKGRPIIGVAWESSGNITGKLRSVALNDILAALPEDALIVNLQYGETEETLQNAKKAFPKMDFHTSEIDQMQDMVGFASQVLACDAIVTIDNTTAHVCGAVGHPNAHMLLPKGADLMWYWGDADEGVDDWYRVLKTHRQESPRDWSSALGSLKQSLS